MHELLKVDQQQTAAILECAQLRRAIALLIGIGSFVDLTCGSGEPACNGTMVAKPGSAVRP
jgi:hypothetical protein